MAGCQHSVIATFQLPMVVLLLFPLTSRSVPLSDDDVTISGYYDESRRLLMSDISTTPMATGSSKLRDSVAHLSTIVPDAISSVRSVRSDSADGDITITTPLSPSTMFSVDAVSTTIAIGAAINIRTTHSEATPSERDNITNSHTTHTVANPTTLVHSTHTTGLPETTSPTTHEVVTTGARLKTHASPVGRVASSKPLTATTGLDHCNSCDWTRSNLEITTWLATEVCFSLLLIAIVFAMGVMRCCREWRTRDFKSLRQQLDF